MPRPLRTRTWPGERKRQAGAAPVASGARSGTARAVAARVGAVPERADGRYNRRFPLPSPPMSHNTIEINRAMDRFDGHHSVWLFGYGSLIYKADFPYLERRPASIAGWTRRFWQGSHDHRGTPEAPGRVATIVPAPGAICHGMAYLVTPEEFAHLDHREKNGYLRLAIDIHFDGGGAEEGLVYIARHDNAAYLGEAPELEIASHIARAHGPSGPNAEYLLRLAQALREMGHVDEHVFAIEDYLAEMDEGGLPRPA